jgi:putative hemolysin
MMNSNVRHEAIAEGGMGRRFAIEVAHSGAGVIEALRLRFRVFKNHLRADADTLDLDCDRFDPFCDHLLVRDVATGRLAGTYRMLGSAAARRAGGFYSESEFDLAPIKRLRGRILELGRASVDPDYRSGAVISALWGGIFNYIAAGEYDYLIGCGSVPLAPDRRSAAAVCRLLTRAHLSPPDLRARPYQPFCPSEQDAGGIADALIPMTIPPLIKGYLRLGAWVCGTPALDPEFNVADLLVLLPMARLDERYASHYRRATSRWPPSQTSSIAC